ncbi:30S ribosomal protein S5 [Candidatus Falkowbacteria bacterium]|jgi:small subunit ribosomal protein S5|nr:30S ribosomal protein S5 [Candidatus Falkowbacteria bacterium]MBT7007151.1 30S ribosomal protein S5 [Candidatus Falkowbacteria bacterium]
MENNNKDNRSRRKFVKREAPEFDQKIIDLARVTRVMAGGKRMRFRATVAIGNKKGKMGIGVAKGKDVAIAVNKAANRAKKNTVLVPIMNETIPHVVRIKFKAAKLLLKPAPKGTAVKAGGAVRVMLELAGVPNVVAKILGTNNKMNNVKALMLAVSQLRTEPLRKEKVAKEKKAPKEVTEKKEVAKKKTEEKVEPKKDDK